MEPEQKPDNIDYKPLFNAIVQKDMSAIKEHLSDLLQIATKAKDESSLKRPDQYLTDTIFAVIGSLPREERLQTCQWLYKIIIEKNEDENYVETVLTKIQKIIDKLSKAEQLQAYKWLEDEGFFDEYKARKAFNAIIGLPAEEKFEAYKWIVAAAHDYGHTSAAEKALSIIYALPEEEQFQAYQWVYDHGVHHIKKQSLQKAFNVIDTLPEEEQFQAYQWVYEHGDSDLQKQSLQKAFDVINALSEEEQFRAYLLVSQQAKKETNETLEKQALEKCFHAIDYLPKEKREQTALSIANNEPKNSSLKKKLEEKYGFLSRTSFLQNLEGLNM